ncbi:MAG: carbohydrate-binding domain-containing protein [Lachnospiraceae bacterium]|nr:carbohydrate-binding domain-containing protein [Lachnospiraceae bacterium]
MMRKIRIPAILLCFLLLITGCSRASDTADTPDSPERGMEDYDSRIMTPPAPEASTERTARDITATITLADDNIEIKGSGARADGNTLVIFADGVYEVSGVLSDGRIVIDAPDKAIVELVLSGVDISNSRNAAVYCKNCDEFIITLAENTQNFLSDAKNYIYDDDAKQEPDAAIFSKTDLNIGGSGWLTINANFNHGISSKDDLVIEGGGFTVTSVVDAIRGKDSLVILDGKFELDAGGDGLQASSNDGAEFGYVQIMGGEYTINACGDAIQAETVLTISGGTFSITTEGTPAGESDSQKGLKAGTLLTVEDGTFRIISRDDAVHSNIDAQINGGTFYIETGDDGVHADRNLYINGGEINIPVCYEGFEGTVIEVNGGKSFIVARDDAVSAAAGVPEAKVNAERGGNPNVYVVFNGGELEAVSGGDTVDSNGNIYVNGGTLRLSAPPRPSYEGGLFCNGSVTISGGNVVQVGNLGVGLYAEEQPVLWVSHVKEQAEGSILSLQDQSGSTLLELTAQKSFIQSVFTCAELQLGSTYSVCVDGEKIIDVTLTETVTKIGDDGGEFTGGYSRGGW